MEVILTAFGAIGLLCLLIIYNSFSWGYVLFKFWYWFILPVFTTLPHITFVQAIGIMFFISLFKNRDLSEYSLKGTEIKKKTNWVAEIISPWILICIVLFVRLFM